MYEQAAWRYYHVRLRCRAEWQMNETRMGHKMGLLFEDSIATVESNGEMADTEAFLALPRPECN